ncbi:MAG: deoxynucleoside kinase [Cetobacterium sp.]
MSPLIYCIDGNIGTGKSTILKGLENNGYFVFQEDLSDWGELLNRYYNDKQRWMCTLQLAILHSMHQQYQTIKKLQHPIVFIERSPAASMVFVENGIRQGFMDDEETRVVRNMYELLKWSPDLSFYIDTPVDVCYERVKQRQRECEGSITREYLNMVHLGYVECYNRQKNIKIDGTEGVESIVLKILEKINEN